MDSLVGSQIAKYQVISVIGEDGGSVAYHANDLLLSRPVTLRVIPRQATHQPFSQERILQELLPAARLSHPSIAALYRYGEQDGIFFLVSEYAPGLALSHLLRRLQEQSQIVRLDEALYLTGLALDALTFAHSNGVVHGYIRPEKLRVIRLSQPVKPGKPLLALKIVDYGLAGLLRRDGPSASRDVQVADPYRPPPAPGDPLSGEQLDLYAFAAILFEMVTGNTLATARVAEGSSGNMADTSTAPGLAGLPRPVADFLTRALDLRPIARYQSAAEMGLALQHVLRSVTRSKGNAPAPAVATTSLVQQATSPVKEPAGSDNAGGDSLIVSLPDGATQVFRLNRPVMTVGRSESNDIVLQSNTVSRRHLRLEQNPGGWDVTDLGSKNRTMLAERTLEPGRAVSWTSGEELNVGVLRLHWLPEIVEFPADAVEPSPSDGSKGLKSILISVYPEALRLTPGDRAELQVDVLNPTKSPVHCRLAVSGLQEEWVALERNSLHLAPETREKVSLAIHLPRSSATIAERRAFEIRAYPGDDPTSMVSVPVRLTILVFVHFSTQLEPTLLQRDGSCQVIISNNGNTETTFNVRAEADEGVRQLRLDIEPALLRLAPGKSGLVNVRISALERHLFGGRKAVRWRVRVGSSGAGQETLTGHYLLEPRLSGRRAVLYAGLLLLMFLLLMLALALVQ